MGVTSFTKSRVIAKVYDSPT